MPTSLRTQRDLSPLALSLLLVAAALLAACMAWPALAVLALLSVLRTRTYRVRTRLAPGVDARDWRTLARRVDASRLGAHMLDPTPEAMLSAETAPADSPAHVRMLPVSTYLTALAWDVPHGRTEVTVYHVLATWCHAKLWTRWPLAIALGLVPSRAPLLRIPLFRNDGTDALRAFDALAGAPSLNWLTGVTEFGHYVRSKLPSPLSDLVAHVQASPTTCVPPAATVAPVPPSSDVQKPTPSPTRDAVLAQFGDASLPDTVATERLTETALLRAKSAAPGRDVRLPVYETPSPLLDDLFPGLCFGAGGLTPLQTPLKQATNELVANVLNRLAANTLVDAGLAPEPFASRARFELLLPNAREPRVTSLREFVERVPGIRVFFSRAASSFGLFFCLRDAGAPPPRAATSTDPASRLAYAQIPVAWPARVALRDPATGRQHAILAFHDALVVEGDAQRCPLGEFRVQHHLGPDGCANWKPGDEMVRPWAPLEAHAIDEAQWPRVVALAGLAACASNWSSSRVHGFEFGGYGIHGACSDSTALLRACVNGGRPDTFPLYATGDGKAGFAFACRDVLAPRLAAAAARSSDERARARLETDAVELERLARAVVELPNDIDMPLGALPATMDRMLKTTPGEFVCAKRARVEIRRLREEWGRVLRCEAGASPDSSHDHDGE